MTTECRFDVWRSETGEYQVRLAIDEEAAITAPFDFELFTLGRQREVIAKIEVGGCQNTELVELGTHLWNALCPQPIRARLEQIDGAYVIAISAAGYEISRLPWEVIFDETRKAYLALDVSRPLVRALPAEREQRGAGHSERRGPLSVLVIVPQNSGLDTISEQANLRRAASRIGAQRFCVSTLDGLVTSERIRAELKKEYDVLHFIGHSRLNRTTGVVEIRINSEESADGEQWLDANQVAELLSGSTVRLVVFNSCESASGESTVIEGLGEQVARRGDVRAVVAMRYKIDDVSSRRFSDSFYGELLNSKHAGRVDIAMQSTRAAMYTSARPDALRSFITPVLYLAPGCAQLFEADRLTALPAAGAVASAAAGESEVRIPNELVEQLKRGRCVPIIGPSVYPVATRDALLATPPTLLRLLSDLANEVQYPDLDELTIVESMADFTAVVCPRIFQHYESEKERYQLVDWLQAHCTTEQPSSLMMQVAGWSNVPGLVYTHFDGMMEEALRRASHPFRVVNMPQQPLVSTAQITAEATRLLLFNLRGTLGDYDSLVLTDFDHERLLDNLVKANADVIGLFKALGRSVLFLGVSPVDPAVRRLARLYLETGKSMQGPRYFVVPHVSAGDKAYWRDFNIRWIYEEPARVVEALNAKVRTS